MNRKSFQFDEDDDDEKNATNQVDSPQEPALLAAIKQHLRLKYEPTLDYVNAIRMTTQEVFNAFQQLYPSKGYDEEYICEWLHEQGFTFKDEGNLRFVWLLKEVSEA